MTNLISRVLLLVTLLISSKINATNCTSLAELNWLLGAWQTQEQQRITTEKWTKSSDKTFEGAGKTANNHESLRLLEMSGEIFYLAKVSHNPVPVAFKLVHCPVSEEGKRYIFENKQHDFPNTIEYQKISENSMLIKVSGKPEKSFTIQLHRVQNKATKPKSNSDTKQL
jgi:hypothetical protein